MFYFNPYSIRDLNVSQSLAHLNCDHTLLFAISFKPKLSAMSWHLFIMKDVI